MSVPGRIGAWMSAMRAGAGEARVDMDERRATPLRFHHEAEGDRMVLRHVGAHVDDDSQQFSRSQRAMVAAPRPKEVPKLGTEEECQIRAWFSMLTTPSPPPSSFLMR